MYSNLYYCWPVNLMYLQDSPDQSRVLATMQYILKYLFIYKCVFIHNE